MEDEQEIVMPLDKYFGGHGEKVMRSMKEQYGSEKGKKVFYATENKRKQKKKGNVDTSPSRSMMNKHNVDY